MVAHQRTRHAEAMPKDKPKVMPNAIAKRIKKLRHKVAAGKPIKLRDKVPAGKLTIKPNIIVRDMFFRDESQRSELGKLLSEYISAVDAVVEVAVPGDICSSRVHRKASYHARTGISALLDWVVRLDDLDFSLNGKFSLSDWGITHSGVLKGTFSLMGKLVRRTEAAIKSTMLILGTAIEQIFSNASPTPVDVADLVEILKNFTPALKPLLRIHVARENGTGKSVIFTKMFDRLESIKDNGTNTYTNIENQIPLEKNWVHKAMTNVHLTQNSTLSV